MKEWSGLLQKGEDVGLSLFKGIGRHDRDASRADPLDVNSPVLLTIESLLLLILEALIGRVVLLYQVVDLNVSGDAIERRQGSCGGAR